MGEARKGSPQNSLADQLIVVAMVRVFDWLLPAPDATLTPILPDPETPSTCEVLFKPVVQIFYVRGD